MPAFPAYKQQQLVDRLMLLIAQFFRCLQIVLADDHRRHDFSGIETTASRWQTHFMQLVTCHKEYTKPFAFDGKILFDFVCACMLIPALVLFIPFIALYVPLTAAAEHSDWLGILMLYGRGLLFELIMASPILCWLHASFTAPRSLRLTEAGVRFRTWLGLYDYRWKDLQLEVRKPRDKYFVLNASGKQWVIDTGFSNFDSLRDEVKRNLPPRLEKLDGRDSFGRSAGGMVHIAGVTRSGILGALNLVGTTSANTQVLITSTGSITQTGIAPRISSPTITLTSNGGNVGGTNTGPNAIVVASPTAAAPKLTKSSAIDCNCASRALDFPPFVLMPPLLWRAQLKESHFTRIMRLQLSSLDSSWIRRACRLEQSRTRRAAP